MATEWGRKETIFWPLHLPIWTYSAVLLTLVCTVLFGWERLIILSHLAAVGQRGLRALRGRPTLPPARKSTVSST